MAICLIDFQAMILSKSFDLLRFQLRKFNDAYCYSGTDRSRLIRRQEDLTALSFSF